MLLTSLLPRIPRMGKVVIKTHLLNSTLTNGECFTSGICQ